MIQISRRSNRLNPERDTAALKLLKGGHVDEEPDMRSWRDNPCGAVCGAAGAPVPGDSDEHGAVIWQVPASRTVACAWSRASSTWLRTAWTTCPGKRGYRMLKAEFIQGRILRARDRRLAYLAIHNHGGTDSVGILRARHGVTRTGVSSAPRHSAGHAGRCAGVRAVRGAGDLVFRGCDRAPLSHAANYRAPSAVAVSEAGDEGGRVRKYDRQSRLFGDAGQELLGRTRVGIVGLGARAPCWPNFWGD